MSTLTIDIRPADSRDAEGVAEVHAAAWQNAYAGIIPYKALRNMIGRRDHRWWQRAIRRGTSVLVLDLGDTIAGYATFGLNRARALPQDGEVYEIYLRPEYQGVGFGSRLFAAARGQLAGHGCKGLIVWALQDNDGAVEFYRGQGGQAVAEGAETFDGQRLKKLAFAWD